MSGLDLGLSLIHCGLGLGLKKIFWASASSSASLFLASASALASCPAGLVNIPGVNELVVSPGPAGLRDGHESAGGQPALVQLAEQLLALVRADVVEKLQHQDQVHRLIQTFTHTVKGGNVTSAGWQETLCDPMWHVSSGSGVATLRTAMDTLVTYLLTYAVSN